MRNIYLSVEFGLLLLTYCYASRKEQPQLTELIRNPRQSRCSSNQFTCSNGQCIDNYQVCDGERNCRDGTDETQAVCTKLGITCPTFAFRCAYGACVNKDVVCDGKQDCADNSDELLPSCLPIDQKPERSSKCKKNEFSCNSGQCINEFSVCDGVKDCTDGTDETITQCVNIRCPAFSFQCAYGACIDLDKKCNGIKDCGDGSDEFEELCETNNVVVVNRPPTTTTTERPVTWSNITPRNGCQLPEKPDGSNYKVEGCSSNDRSNKCRTVPGTWVQELTVLTYICDQGYALPQNNNIFCLNSTWSPQQINCQKMCKPLYSDSMNLFCLLHGQKVACDLPARPGTKVQPKCKTSFHVADPSAAFKETFCQEDGTWELPLFKCVADCGKPSYNTGKPLILYGTLVVTGEYPWHAGLYLKKQGTFTHSCGGTIITPHIVLTAAHCVYNDTAHRVINTENIQVAVGKFSRAWDVIDPHEQRLAVKEIIPQRAYRGLSNSYEQDIAAIDLENSIVLSNVVLPACIDWTSEGVLSVGMFGTVVGWGLDENDQPSEELKAASLPFMDYDTCRHQSPESFLRFITYDKFCAGPNNGTSVQRGDSGGGITFMRQNKLHFLYGIVSIKPVNLNTFAAYTNIKDHIDWLQGVVNALKVRHNLQSN